MLQSQLLQLITMVLPLAVVAGTAGLVWWSRRYHRAALERRARSFRGDCGRCGYQPQTGTRTCPECGGAVLDTRLFRPLGEDRPRRPSRGGATG